MSTELETQSKNGRRILYIVIAVGLGLLLIAALISYRSAKSSQQAEQKADQLIAALQQQGARTPSREAVVRVLGDDGGAVCSNPDAALNRATFYGLLTNGAAGPGMRPVIADNKVIQGQLLIMQVYCPDKLDDVKEWLEDVKTALLVRV
jgi:hypothetical protein